MNWLERLTNRKIRVDLYDQLAKEWTTCAIGEIHDQYPSTVKKALYGEAPIDVVFRSLGNDFYEAVSGNKRKEAIRIYRAIHKHLATLICKQLVKFK